MATTVVPTAVCDAVQVTADNLDTVAAWCGGTVLGVVDSRSAIALTPDGPYAAVGRWIIRRNDRFIVADEMTA